MRITEPLHSINPDFLIRPNSRSPRRRERAELIRPERGNEGSGPEPPSHPPSVGDRIKVIDRVALERATRQGFGSPRNRRSAVRGLFSWGRIGRTELDMD